MQAKYQPHRAFVHLRLLKAGVGGQRGIWTPREEREKKERKKKSREKKEREREGEREKEK
jgi:hypothetical protein